MASKTSICNLALTRLAASRIIDINSDTSEAKDLFAVYDLVVDETIALGSWPSARRRASLALLSSTPAFGFTYTYQLPIDCLKVLAIDEWKTGSIPYAIEGNTILSNTTSLSIYYLGKIDDPNQYDIWLRQAIVDRLVAELAYSKTASQNAYVQAIQYAEKHAMDLLAQCALATNAADMNSDTFIDARHSIWPTDTDN